MGIFCGFCRYNFAFVVLGVFGYFSSLRGVLGTNISVHRVTLLDEM